MTDEIWKLIKRSNVKLLVQSLRLLLFCRCIHSHYFTFNFLQMLVSVVLDVKLTVANSLPSFSDCV